MTQVHISPRIHTSRTWRKRFKTRTKREDSSWRSFAVDLDTSSDFFLICPGWFLMFSAAGPNASSRQMTTFAAHETAFLQDAVAIMAGQ